MTKEKLKKHRINPRNLLIGLCESKVQRFKDDLIRERKHSNITPQWLYNRIKKLLAPGNYVHCETCGMLMTFEGITIDHKVPRSDHVNYNGNIHNTENLELICPTCNSLKGQKTLSEFLAYLQDRNNQTSFLIQHGTKGIIAPMFPNIGMGIRLFGKDKSAAKHNGS
jgi:5-methylcytosine-specific restriction endonuclease McrA